MMSEKTERGSDRAHPVKCMAAAAFPRRTVARSAFAVLFLALLLGDARPIPAQLSAFSYRPISIPTRDAKSLAADIWSSTNSGPTEAKPVILIQTPYNRKLYRAGTIPGFAGGDLFPANTNYHYVVVDWRGFFESRDAAVAGYNRGLDGYDCVEWIASQPWSNGRVGTWGSSALGQIQYLTGFQHPPHLVCCTVQVRFFQTSYEDYYYGGDYRKEQTESIGRLGLIDPAAILAHPTRDLFWRTIESTTDTPEQVAVPILVVGGWFDHSPDAVLRSFAELQARSAPAVREQHRLIQGPWTHGGLGESQQGILTFPNTTNLLTTEVQFWDYHLRQQVDNSWSSQPVVQFYQMGENTWIDDQSWAGPKTWAGVPRIAQSLHLRADGRLTTEPPDFNEAFDEFIYDPADPTPSFGGARFAVFDNSVLDGPLDQATNIETRADLRIYSTAVLTNDLRLNATNLVLVLSASSDRTDTDFAVRLTDVDPEGRSVLLAQGIRRARFRDSLTTPQLLTPGAIVTIPITLQNLAHTFRRGHRLRLVVSSADYPMYDRNLNDGGPLYTTGTPLPARNRLYHDAVHLSRLDFQVLPDDLDGDGLADVWEADRFGNLRRDGSGDFDGDSLTDGDEYFAGTDPVDAASLLRCDAAAQPASGELELSWSSVADRTYEVLKASAPAGPYLAIATNLTSTPPRNRYPVPAPAPGGAVFLKVRVRP